MDLIKNKKEVKYPINIGMFSYGSGLAASWFELHVNNLVPFKNLVYLDKYLENRVQVEPKVYDQLMEQRRQNYGKCNITPQCKESWLWDDQYI